MKSVQRIQELNPTYDLNKVAEAMIGAPDYGWNNHPNLNGLNLEGVYNECNSSNLFSDADAIVIGSVLKDGKYQGIHALSHTIKAYYGNSGSREDLLKRIPKRLSSKLNGS